MFETDRLQLLPFRPPYFVALHNLFCKNEMAMATALKGRLFTDRELLSLIAEKFILKEVDKHGFWCLFSKENQVFVGIAGLLQCNYLSRDDYEFGFILDDAFWGQGLATEIGAFSIQYAREVLQLDRVLATVSPDNQSSVRVLEKLGMSLECELMVEDRGARWVYGLLFAKGE